MSTVTEGLKNLLILLAISQSPSIRLKDIDRLDVIRHEMNSLLDSIVGASVRLDNLADDMDSGNVDYYGNTDEIRKEAQALNSMRKKIVSLLHSAEKIK